MTRGISPADARSLLDIAATVEYDAARASYTDETLTAVRDLVGADWLTYSERFEAERWATVNGEVETRPFIGHHPEIEAVFREHQHRYPFWRAEPAMPDVSLLLDLTSRRAWHANPFYAEWCRTVRLEPQARINISASGPIRRSLIFDLADDADRTFGERERTLLELVRPSLLRPVVRLDATRARHRALSLTPRELEILELIRGGRTNGEIAAVLFISPTTVRTHLENVFAKLGAHTRNGAIARLDEIGSRQLP